VSDGPLAGQVAVVTGGNGGIGLGMAQGLAAAGADVAIWARDEAKSEAASAGLRKAHPDGRTFPTFPCDVADPDSVVRALESTVGALGRVDTCVANAGTSSRAPFLDLTLEEWRRVMAVNLDGVFVTLQAAARQMVTQGEGGALVAVASTAAVHGAPVTAHYAAAKTGVLGLVRSAAVALARHRIRVNAVLPGWTVTDLARGGYDDERFRAATTSRTPVRRWAEPSEFGAVAAYLGDKAHLFHTGDAVCVDGGYTVF
jgi:NAD(P)-dependent dehydrogenase (short-subunit alcohol dehydrogenase family)